MDAILQDLYARLDDGGREKLDSVVSSACSELEREGVIDRLPPEWAVRVNDPDPSAAADGKTAAARAAGRQFIIEETALPRANGSVARLALVMPDPRFAGCITLALIASAEALIGSGLTKYRRIAFYIRCETGEALSPEPLRAAVETLNSFYPRIDFELIGEKAEKKPGLLKRLFGKRPRAGAES